MGKNNNTYVTREELTALMQSAIAEALKSVIGGAQTTSAQPQSTAQTSKGKRPYVKADGTTVMASEAQIANWERFKANAKPLTDAQKERISAIKASKEREPKLTRALEKELKIKANSLASTSCTVAEALACGWSPKAKDKAGRRAELKSIKAKIRASVK